MVVEIIRLALRLELADRLPIGRLLLVAIARQPIPPARAEAGRFALGDRALAVRRQHVEERGEQRRDGLVSVERGIALWLGVISLVLLVVGHVAIRLGRRLDARLWVHVDGQHRRAVGRARRDVGE